MAGVAYVVLATLGYVFKLGNSRRRSRGWMEALRAFSREVAQQSGLQESDQNSMRAVLRKLLVGMWAPFRAIWRMPAAMRARRRVKREAKFSTEAAEEAARLSTVRARRIAALRGEEMESSMALATSKAISRNAGRSVRLMPEPYYGIDPPPNTPTASCSGRRHARSGRLMSSSLPSNSSMGISVVTSAGVSVDAGPALHKECLEQQQGYSISKSASHHAKPARGPSDDTSRGEFGLLIMPLPPIQQRPAHRHASPPPSPPTLSLAATGPDSWTSVALPGEGSSGISRRLSRRFTRGRPAALERSCSGLRASGRALVGQVSSLGASSAALFSPTAVRVQKAKQKDGSQVAVLALAAVRQKRKADAKWRSNADRCRRLTLAWAFNLGVCAVFIFYALIASLKFGERDTRPLFGSWGASYLYGTILLEPGMICLLSAMPFLSNENTRVGRCCLRVKWCWDELLSP